MEQEKSMVVPKRVWESVKMYTIQCSDCLKWRLIPTKEKYEEIREKIAEESFRCESAREWRPNVSCKDESDVNQDGSLCWAMDRPSIPRTPSGWQRILRVRAEGGTKFADIYYVAPTNKRLRSMVELDRYLADHPIYQQQGINTSEFCFQPPIPLDANYVSKRLALSPSALDKDGSPTAARPLLQIASHRGVYSQLREPSGRKKLNDAPSGSRGGADKEL